MWWVPLVTAVAGAIEGDAKQKRNEKKLQAQAEVAKWSPWTGLAPHDVPTEDSAVHGAMQGGVAGMGMMQGMKGTKPSAGAESAPEGGTVPYSSTGNTSNYRLPPPVAESPAQKYEFNTQAEPNMSQETLTPEDAALQRKYPWAQKYEFNTQAEPNMSQETLTPEDAALQRKYPWAQTPNTTNQSRRR